MIKYENENIGKIATWRAKEWAKKQTYLNFQELLSIAYLAVSKAVNKYDDSKNTKLTTYLTICIDNAIKTAITKEAKQYRLKEVAENQYIRKQEQEREAEDVRNAIVNCLNEEEQQIVNLYFYKRKTLQEIAEIYSTNHVQIHRKIEKIKEKMREGLTK